MVRVLLVDSQAIFRHGLRVVLSQRSDLEVVGEAGVAREAIAQVKALVPDVVVLDFDMVTSNGPELTSNIRRHHAGVALVLLGPNEDEALFLAIKAGAAAYYPKDVAPEELAKGVVKVAQGEYLIN